MRSFQSCRRPYGVQLVRLQGTACVMNDARLTQRIIPRQGNEDQQIPQGTSCRS